MPAAFTVIGGLFVKRAVVVIENDVLALVADHVRDAGEVPLMCGEHKCRRVECQHHPGRVDISTLVIVATGILTSGYSDIRRVLPGAVFGPIRAGDKDSVIAEAQPVLVAVTPGYSK